MTNAGYSSNHRVSNSFDERLANDKIGAHTKSI
jgi:hypothetical protein